MHFSRSYFYFEAAGFRAVCRWDFQAAAEAGIAGPAVYLCVCVCVSVSRLTCCRPADPSPSIPLGTPLLLLQLQAKEVIP